MKGLKWAELSGPGCSETKRYESFQEFLIHQEVDSQLEFVEAGPSEALEKLKELMAVKDYICIGSPLNVDLLSQISDLTIECRTSSWIDGFLRYQNRWWPRSFLPGVFQREVTPYMNHLLLESTVLILGSEPIVVPIVSGLTKIGFTRIGIVDEDIESARKLIERLQLTFYSIEFFVVPVEEVVSLPGLTAILVNSLSGSDSDEVLKYFYYFNFLVPNGLLIDLDYMRVDSDLRENARLFGAKILEGHQIIASVDLQWLREITGLHFDSKSYQKNLFDHLHSK